MKKTLLNLTRVAFGIFLILFAFSCGGNKSTAPETNPEVDSLKNTNSGLQGQLSEKEVALQDMVTAFNDIQSNLNEIKDKEKIVTNNTQGGDVKGKEVQIKEDIQSIYDLMAKNRSRLAAVSKKLKVSNAKIDGLEQMVTNLEAQLNDKDAQISDLKNKVEQLNIELSTLNTNYQNVEQESQQKTEKLNTAYYVIGTAKELKQKGIIEKEGGFVGLGKTTEIKKDFNRSYFTKVDAAQLASIPIGAKKVKILSEHPAGSYKLVGTKPIEKLDISNSDEFWSTSKYLVIMIE